MKQQHSIDGFVPRRSSAQAGGVGEPTRPVGEVNRFYPGSLPSPDQPIASRRSEAVISRADLDESLKGIDTPEESKKDRKRRKKKGDPKSRKRRIIKWVIITLVVILLAIGGWILYKAMHAGGNVFKGNILDIIKNQPLKQDENGRSNILVLGTSEDDPKHDAPWLTDSIMVVSVDQKNKNAYMISIPRDLEVHYGQSCMTGNSGKINAYYQCVGGGEGNIEADRAALTKEAGFIGNIVGLDIQYGVNVNYTVMRELVNAVGGITVNIEGNGPVPAGIAPGSVMDSNFDWKCGATYAKRLVNCAPRGHFIDYGPGPANLDAEHALYLAQARGDSYPTWGLARSNFDRELNQQKIVKAIREKAMSAGVLANFTKVTGIIDALGNNLRTTFETSEVRTLVALAKDIKSDDIQSISLIDGDNPVMNGNAQPTAGKYQFGQLQAYIKKRLSSNPVVREEAKIVVLNGSGVAGVGLTEANSLEAQGFTISGVDNAPAGTYGDIEIYQIGKGMSATKAKLESMYKVKVKTTAPPVSVADGTNFIIIVGKDRSSKNQ